MNLKNDRRGSGPSICMCNVLDLRFDSGTFVIKVAVPALRFRHSALEIFLLTVCLSCTPIPYHI